MVRRSSAIAERAAPEAPAPLDRERERPIERAAVVVDRRAAIAARHPVRHVGRGLVANHETLAGTRMIELEPRGVEHEPRGERAPIERIAGDGRAGMRELDAGLVRATRLEPQLEERAVFLARAHADLREGALRATAPRSPPRPPPRPRSRPRPRPLARCDAITSMRPPSPLRRRSSSVASRERSGQPVTAAR